MIFPGFPGVLSFFQVFQVEWEPCAFPCKNKLIWFVKTIAHFRRQLQSRTHKVIGLISVRQDPSWPQRNTAIKSIACNGSYVQQTHWNEIVLHNANNWNKWLSFLLQIQQIIGSLNFLTWRKQSLLQCSTIFFFSIYPTHQHKLCLPPIITDAVIREISILRFPCGENA